MMITMRRSGGRSGASASRKPALLDRTKSWRQAKVIKVVIIIPANVISMITIIPAVVSSMIILMCRQEKRLALEEGLRRPPSQPLPSLRPLSQPPSLRLFFILSSSPSWSSMLSLLLPPSSSLCLSSSHFLQSQATSSFSALALTSWAVFGPEIPHVDSWTGEVKNW